MKGIRNGRAGQKMGDFGEIIRKSRIIRRWLWNSPGDRGPRPDSLTDSACGSVKTIYTTDAILALSVAAAFVVPRHSFYRGRSGQSG